MTSPARESCSTRCGSDEVGGASSVGFPAAPGRLLDGRGLVGRAGRRSGGCRGPRGTLLARAQPPARARVDDDRLLEGLVALHRAVPLGPAAPAARAGGLRLGGRLRCVAGEAVDEVAQPGGHLVDGGRGEHEDPEQAEQHEQGHGAVHRHRRLERAGREEPDDPARLAHRVGAHRRGRDVVRDVDQAAGREGQGGGADRHPRGGGLVPWCAEHPQAEEQQDDRDGVPDLAERAGDDGVDDHPDGAGHPPPLPGGDDDGERDEEQADAVAAVLRLEVATGVADLAGDRAGGVRQAHPRRPGGAQRQREPAGARAGAAARPDRALAGGGPGGAAARAGRRGRACRHGGRLRKSHSGLTRHTRRAGIGLRPR